MRYFLHFLILLSCTGIAHAKLMKCTVKDGTRSTVSYFSSKNKTARKQCSSKPTYVSSIKNTKVRVTYGTHAQKKTINKAAKKARCTNSGGTVKIHGKTFHLAPSSLCLAYAKRQKHLNGKRIRLGGLDKAYQKKIAPYVNKMAKKHGMDPAFIHAIISAESAYRPNATSHVGAMGLMQLMPFTAKRFGVSDAYNPHQNIRAGIRYLKILYNEFGSLELAAAGYNAGEAAVRKYNNSIPPYKETMKYVPKVMAYYRRYKNNRKLIAKK